MISNNTLGNESLDEDNEDNNTLTDKFITFNWADMNASWPGVDLPVTLAKVKFKISDNVDPQAQSTILSLTSDDNASGYSFKGYSLLLGGEQGFENEYTSDSFNFTNDDEIDVIIPWEPEKDPSLPASILSKKLPASADNPPSSSICFIFPRRTSNRSMTMR